MLIEPGTRLGTPSSRRLEKAVWGPCIGPGTGELNRDVAIKVLQAEVSADRISWRDSRARQVLASLNHPNIAAIYGLTEVAGGKALVLELVEGRPLPTV